MRPARKPRYVLQAPYETHQVCRAVLIAPGIKPSHSPHARKAHRVGPWQGLLHHTNYAGALSLEPTSSPAQGIQRGNKHSLPESPSAIYQLILESL